MTTRPERGVKRLAADERRPSVVSAQTIVERAERPCARNGPCARQTRLSRPVLVHHFAEYAPVELRDARILRARHDEVELAFYPRRNQNLLVENLLERLADGDFKRVSEHPCVGIRHIALDSAWRLLRLVGGRLFDDKIPVHEIVGRQPRRASSGKPRPVAKRLAQSQLLLAVASKFWPPCAKRLVVVHKPLLDDTMHGRREKRLLGREDREKRIALDRRGSGARRKRSREHVYGLLSVSVGAELHAALIAACNRFIHEPLTFRLLVRSRNNRSHCSHHAHN